METHERVPLREPRVLIVAENASEKFGGEAVLPLHYFRRLRARGVDARLLTHARVRDELARTMPDDVDRMHFVEDSTFQQLVSKFGLLLQPRLRYLTNDFILRLLTQHAQRRLARGLVERFGIDVVHQPTPVSPREPSLLADLGAPVVIGPMNCAVDYPAAFRDREWLLTRALVWFGRTSSSLLNAIFSGKRRAALLLVANDRSRDALTGCSQVEIRQVPENGIDLSLWRSRSRDPRPSPACRFVFVGRLIPSKGADLLLRALKRVVADGVAISVLVLGDGREASALKEQARADGTLADHPDEPGKAFFAGWQPHSALGGLLATQDCLVFPTLHECGGAVVLEAMASELPVVTSGWGGPADYVDEQCGILISAGSQESYVADLAAAMVRIARDPALRERLGRAGRRKVEALYTWDSKIDRMLECYRFAMHRRTTSGPTPPTVTTARGLTGGAVL